MKEVSLSRGRKIPLCFGPFEVDGETAFRKTTTSFLTTDVAKFFVSFAECFVEHDVAHNLARLSRDTRKCGLPSPSRTLRIGARMSNVSVLSSRVVPFCHFLS